MDPTWEDLVGPEMAGNCKHDSQGPTLVMVSRKRYQLPDPAEANKKHLTLEPQEFIKLKHEQHAPKPSALSRIPEAQNREMRTKLFTGCLGFYNPVRLLLCALGRMGVAVETMLSRSTSSVL